MLKSSRAALGLAILLCACGRKSVSVELTPFRSPFGDFECLAPTDWTVETAQDSDAYRFTVWLGPEDPQALWGAPRFVAAWHAFGKAFKKASGEPGRYESVEDYVRQMKSTVWTLESTDQEKRYALTVDGRAAERLVVRFEKDAYMSLPGAKPASQGGGRMWRRDVAVVVPTRTGFYTFVFPSAEAVDGKYRPAFDRLVESVRFLKESPVE